MQSKYFFQKNIGKQSFGKDTSSKAVQTDNEKHSIVKNLLFTVLTSLQKIQAF